MKARRSFAVLAALLTAALCCGCEDSKSDSGSEAVSSAADSSAAEAVSSIAETVTSSSPETERPPESSAAEDPSQPEPVIETDPVDGLLSRLPDKELENKTVVRLAYAGIDSGAPSARLFGKKYSGSVDTETVPEGELYTRLAAMVMSDSSPDIVPTDGMDLFPKGAAEGLFAPIDGKIDFTSELWSDVDSRSSFFDYRGQRYGATVETLPEYVCIYARGTIGENSLSDPAALFADGVWSHGWFETLCREFSDPDSGKYALNAYARPEALSASAGMPLITMESGSITSFLEDPILSGVQDWMYGLNEQGFISEGAALNDLAEGRVLFLPARTELLTEGDPAGLPDDVMFVPVPSETKAFTAAKLRGYFFCKGSKNPEGAAAYLDCLKAAVQLDAEAREQSLMADRGWSEEMVLMRRQCIAQADENPVLDCTKGLPDEIYGNLKLEGILGRTMLPGDSAVSWEDTVEELRPRLSYAVMKANDTEPTGP